MSSSTNIGTKGTPWGPHEKLQWLEQQRVKRSYAEEVLGKINAIPGDYFTIEQYGALSFDPEGFPLMSLRSKHWDSTKKSVLVTGGVHGYETSGVQGTIQFAEECARNSDSIARDFNFVIAPCVSPWAYATINRWNREAVDPNRSFVAGDTIEECALLLKHLTNLSIDFIAHFDLHETTDTDATVFKPALAARDGEEEEDEEIPDGFYLVACPERPAFDFRRAIIDAVKSVTHIVPPAMDCFHGVEAEQHGVIILPAPATRLGLCMGATTAPFAVTTEVYPDSPTVDDDTCNAAQVAAVLAGLRFISSLQK